MNSAVAKYIPFTVIYVILIVFFTNYLLLGPLKFTEKIPDFFFYMIYAAIFYFIYGYSISALASKNQCKKVNRKISSFHGIKTAFISVLTYIIIYFVPFIKAPFNEIIGNNILGNSTAEIFFIALNLILVSIVNFFDSTKRSCSLTQSQLEENMKQLDKYLNKKEKKKKVKKIVVRD